MVISSYQVNNVLRVYKGQLRQSKLVNRVNAGNTQIPDKISISAEAKRKAVIDKVASDIYDRITQNGPSNDVEKEVFEKLETEFGEHLAITEGNASDLQFKVLDDNGEAVHSLSLEDSQFLSHKLKEITKEAVDQKMF